MLNSLSSVMRQRSYVRKILVPMLAALAMIGGGLTAGPASADPAPVVTAAATGSIAGKVTNEALAGLPGLEVNVFQQIDDGCGGYDWSLIDTVTTAAAGAYSASALPAGVYRLGVEGGSDYLSEYFENKETLFEATSIPVGSGAVIDKNIALSPSGVIAGKVSGAGAGATGLAGATVTIYQLDDFGFDDDFYPVDETSTNDDGDYRFASLAPGTYRVGFSGLSTHAQEFYNNKATVEAANDVIVTRTAPTAAINAELVAAGHVTGLVTKTVPGFLGLGSTEEPLAGITVTALSGATDVASTTTLADGSYNLGGLGAGSFTLRFADEANGDYATEYYDNAASPSAATTVAVTEGGTTPVASTSLAASSHVTGKVTSLGGGLFEPPATNVVGAEVTAYQNTGTVGSPIWSSVATVETDAAGAYDLKGLGAGTYRVGFAISADYLGQFYNGAASVGTADDVTLTAAGQSRALGTTQLAPAAHATGKITGADDASNTLADIRVTAYQTQGGSRVAVADSYTETDGTYDIGGLVPGSYYFGFVDESETFKDEFYNNQATLAAADPVTASAATPSVANAELAEVPPVEVVGQVSNITSPTITGTPKVGTELTADPGVWDPADTAFTYQWFVNCEEVAGATAKTFTPDFSQLASNIYVEVTGSARDLESDTASSASTARVAPRLVANSVPPAITGLATVGATLTAHDGTWLPADAALTRQWFAGGTLITNATGPTYVPVTADAGKVITLTVTATRATYSSVNVTSAPTTAVALVGAEPMTAGTVTVTGTAQVGQTLTASEGTWTPALTGTDYTYQWIRGASDIPGAMANTYAPVAADVGQPLNVRVTGTKAGYAQRAATSVSTAATVAGTMTAGTPTIPGTAKLGQTLTAIEGTWAPTVDSYTYKWIRDASTVISGATAKTYVPVVADVGKPLKVEVTGTKAGYTSAPATSVATAPTAAGTLTAGTVTVSGTANLGQTLTANEGTWSPSVDGYTYQWIRGASDIPGATSRTYAPGAADVGQTLKVRVTGNKTGYDSASATSASASSATPDTVVPPLFGSSFSGSVKGGKKKATVSVKVRFSNVKTKKVKGSVYVYEGARMVKKGSFKKGKGSFKVKAAKGVHTYTVTFNGGAKYGTKSFTKTVNVK